MLNAFTRVCGYRSRGFLLLAAALSCFACAANGQTSAALTTIYTFTGGADGSDPRASLTQGADGNFYGTTPGGGNGFGTVFKVTPAGVLTTLYTFTGGADGASPYAGLTLGSDGSFYGTTFEGGSGNGGDSYGTVFKITPAGVLTTLYAFTAVANGGEPRAALTLGSDGNFYDTTYVGTSYGGGTVFMVTPAGVLTTLYTFTDGADGSEPVAGLTQGSDGNFYGTTSTAGDSNGGGTVFRITPAGVLTTLYAFTGGADGSQPQAGLTQGSDGNFYGTTYANFNPGPGAYGTVFQITPAGVLTTLYAFTGGADGSEPDAGLTQGSDGNLYGTTSSGGDSNGDGTIFRITPAGALTTLYTFSGGADGSKPEADLVQGSDGNFYGTTYQGGANGDGTVFTLKISPTVTSAAGATATVNQPFTYQITATNTPTFFSATGLPAGLSVNTSTGLISGTPTVSGTFNVGLFAQNSGGAGSATLTLTVTSGPIPAVPTITSISSASAPVGVSFSFAVTATNAPTSFAAAGLPAGLTIDPSSGLISGAASGAGTFVVSLSATNAAGTGTAALTLTFTLAAGDIELLSILSPPTGINIAQNETINLEVSAEYRPGTLKNLVVDVVNAPGTAAYDMVLNQSTVNGFTQCTWMPNTPVGSYFLRATATDITGAAPYFEEPITVIASPSAPPTSVLLSGLDGKTFAAGSTLPLVGLATDASGTPISNATFYVNGTKAVPAGASATGAAEPGQLQPKDAAASVFAQASYQLTAIGDALLTLLDTDSHGVSSVSGAATIHIAAAASGAIPACAITSPAAATHVVPGASVRVSAAATETSGPVAQVEFFVNDTSAGKVTSAPYTLSIPTPTEGQFALTAIATDSQGISQASAPVIVTVASQVVTIAVTGNGEAVVGGKKGKATVTRTGDTSAPLKVRFKIAGAVQAGVDYEALSNPNKLTIPAGASQTEIKLAALNNPGMEGARVAKIRLLPSTDGAYTLGAGVKAKIELIDK